MSARADAFERWLGASLALHLALLLLAQTGWRPALRLPPLDELEIDLSLPPIGGGGKPSPPGPLAARGPLQAGLAPRLPPRAAPPPAPVLEPVAVPAHRLPEIRPEPLPAPPPPEKPPEEKPDAEAKPVAAVPSELPPAPAEAKGPASAPSGVDGGLGTGGAGIQSPGGTGLGGSGGGTGTGTGTGDGPGRSAVLPPRLLNRDDILRNIRRFYPEEERRAGREGRVRLNLRVGADGAVEPVAVLESAGAAFDAAAKRVAALMRYEPARLEGRPVAVRLPQEFVFRLR